MINNDLWTACVTPFKERSVVDYDSLDKCIRFQKRSDNGVLLFGSTGEGLSLSFAEKRAILTHVYSEHANLKIMLGVPSYNLQDALEFLKLANDFPILGYLMSTPIYTKPGVYGQVQWFEQLLSKAAKPVMLYNIPSRAGVVLHLQTVEILKQHEKFVAIKDSGGSLEYMKQCQRIAPEIALYCGDDGMAEAMIECGAVGLISVLSNAFPKITREYVHALKSKFQSPIPWEEICQLLNIATNPIAIKTVLQVIGVIEERDLRLPLTTDDLHFADYDLFYKTCLKFQELDHA